MATTKTPRLELSLIESGDLSWDVDARQGFTDADLRLLKVSSDHTYAAFVSPPVFEDVGGGGGDDINITGTYTGLLDTPYYVEIDQVGPERLKWSNTGGDVLNAEDVVIPLIGNELSLGDGVLIHFDSNTSHTLGDNWTFVGFSGNPQDPNNIDGQGAPLPVEYIGQRYFSEADKKWWTGLDTGTDTWEPVVGIGPKSLRNARYPNGGGHTEGLLWFNTTTQAGEGSVDIYWQDAWRTLVPIKAWTDNGGTLTIDDVALPQLLMEIGGLFRGQLRMNATDLQLTYIGSNPGILKILDADGELYYNDEILSPGKVDAGTVLGLVPGVTIDRELGTDADDLNDFDFLARGGQGNHITFYTVATEGDYEVAYSVGFSGPNGITSVQFRLTDGADSDNVLHEALGVSASMTAANLWGYFYSGVIRLHLTVGMALQIQGQFDGAGQLDIRARGIADGVDRPAIWSGDHQSLGGFSGVGGAAADTDNNSTLQGTVRGGSPTRIALRLINYATV